MSTMSPGVDIGAGDRLRATLAWCRWFERTRAWPIELRVRDALELHSLHLGSAPTVAVGQVMQCTVEPASARMSPAGISRVVLEAPNE